MRSRWQKSHESYKFNVSCVSKDSKVLKEYLVDGNTEQNAWVMAFALFEEDFPSERDYFLVVTKVDDDVEAKP